LIELHIDTHSASESEKMKDMAASQHHFIFPPLLPESTLSSHSNAP